MKKNDDTYKAIGQLTDLYLCNFSEFTVVFSDHFGLSVEIIVEKADIKCIYIGGVTFLAWLIQFCWFGVVLLPRLIKTMLPRFLDERFQAFSGSNSGLRRTGTIQFAVV